MAASRSTHCSPRAASPSSGRNSGQNSGPCTVVLRAWPRSTAANSTWLNPTNWHLCGPNGCGVKSLKAYNSATASKNSDMLAAREFALSSTCVSRKRSSCARQHFLDGVRTRTRKNWWWRFDHWKNPGGVAFRAYEYQRSVQSVGAIHGRVTRE